MYRSVPVTEDRGKGSWIVEPGDVAERLLTVAVWLQPTGPALINGDLLSRSDVWIGPQRSNVAPRRRRSSLRL